MLEAISGSISFSGKVRAAMNAGKKVQKAVTPRVARAKSSATSAEGDRYVPNFANPDDAKGVTWGETIFPPEEVKKMEAMTDKQAIAYMKKLLSKNDYPIKWDKK